MYNNELVLEILLSLDLDGIGIGFTEQLGRFLIDYNFDHLTVSEMSSSSSGPNKMDITNLLNPDDMSRIVDKLEFQNSNKVNKSGFSIYNKHWGDNAITQKEHVILVDHLESRGYHCEQRPTKYTQEMRLFSHKEAKRPIQATNYLVDRARER